MCHYGYIKVHRGKGGGEEIWKRGYGMGWGWVVRNMGGNGGVGEQCLHKWEDVGCRM